MQKIPVQSIIGQLDSYYSKENFKNAKELINFWSQTAIKFEDWGGQLTLENELIGLVRRTGEMMEGLAAIDRALLIIDSGRISDETAIATTWLNCGTTYECFGFFEKALPMYNKAEEAYERLLPGNDPRMGGLYNNMAYAYRELGNPEQAAKLTEQAIEIMLGNHALHDAAVSYVNLAEICEVLMRDTEGEILVKIDNCLMTAYELLNDPGNVRDGNYAYSLKKCVSGYEHFGYDEIARELSERADRIYSENRR